MISSIHYRWEFSESWAACVLCITAHPVCFYQAQSYKKVSVSEDFTADEALLLMSVLRR